MSPNAPLDRAALDRHLPSPGEWQPFPGFPQTWPASDASSIQASALEYLGTPWPTLPASLWLRFTRHGERVPYEQPDIGRLRRLVVMTLAATLDDQFLEDVVDGVWAVCEQTSWCLPAHDWTSRRGTTEEGTVLPDAERPYVDLFAAETAALLGWVDHLLGPRLPAVVRRRLALEVRGRVLEPYLSRTDWVWYAESVNNWNPWIHANLVSCALQLAADREQMLEVIDRSVRGVGIYLDQQPEDGACDEGVRYWWRSIACVVELFEWLRLASGGALNGFASSKLTAASRYPLAMHLGGVWNVNLADGDARPVDDEGSALGYPAQLLYLLGTRLDQPEVRQHALALRAHGSSLEYALGRALLDLGDSSWNRAASASFPYVAQSWMAQTQVLTARWKAGSTEGPFLAVKGGHNDESHNHNDVGSVVIGWDGEPLVIDVGAETYDDDSFRVETRYRKWGNRSANHNVPLVNGFEQVAGGEYRARAVAAVGVEAAWTGSAGEGLARTGSVEAELIGADSVGAGSVMTGSAVAESFPAARVGLSMDLAGAYPVEAGVRTLMREAVLDRPGQQVVLKDAWDLESQPTDPARQSDAVGEAGGGAAGEMGRLAALGPPGLSWTFMLRTEPHLIGDGELQILNVVLCFDTALTPAWTREDLTDPKLRAVWGATLYRLTFADTASRTTGSTTFTFETRA